LKLLLPRLFLEFISLLKEILTFKWSHAMAIIKSWIWLDFHPVSLLKRKRQIKNYVYLDLIFNHSIVKKYFIEKKRKYFQLQN
jgi:hypothetical protein